jgi:hypothetical protein
MNKLLLKQLHDNLVSLEETMKLTLLQTSESNIYRYANYKFYLQKYNDIANIAIKEKPEIKAIISTYPINTIPDSDKMHFANQKKWFEICLTSTALLRSTINNFLDIKGQGIENLKNFFQANLRKAVLIDPANEYDIQDVAEQILIGKGYLKGFDYDREVGRVKVSIKENKPDFIFQKLDLALEIKFSASKVKSKKIVDEINADIQSYSKKYRLLLFIIYDKGSIRDETEFKQGLDNENNVQLIIIKH